MLKKRLPVTIAIVVLSGSLAGGAEGPRPVESWTNPEAPMREYGKLLIIGITDLHDQRHSFEDKFVTHLRTAGIEGVPSHSIIPRLDRVEDRKAVVNSLEKQGVDGAITVRLVPLETKKEDEWAESWRMRNDEKLRIRDLVEQTLPVSEKKAKRYGVEVGLWEGGGWNMVWSARSGLHTRHELDGEGGSFVQGIMQALRDAGLMR